MTQGEYRHIQLISDTFHWREVYNKFLFVVVSPYLDFLFKVCLLDVCGASGTIRVERGEYQKE